MRTHGPPAPARAAASHPPVRTARAGSAAYANATVQPQHWQCLSKTVVRTQSEARAQATFQHRSVTACGHAVLRST